MPSRHAGFRQVVTNLHTQFGVVFAKQPASDAQPLSDRIRRCLSWLRRAADVSAEDRPPKFVDLWIAFNSLYGLQHYKQDSFKGEKADFVGFLTRVNGLHHQNALNDWVHKKHVQGRIRDLIQNKFLWNEFWDGNQEEYESLVGKELRRFDLGLANQEAEVLLHCLFARLRVLRNQIIHGSASSDTRRNKDALVPAILLLEEFLPILVRIMIEKGGAVSWPPVPYPGRLTPQHPQ